MFLLSIICLAPEIAFGQRVITGRVVDADQNPIPHVTLRATGNPGNKTVANVKGFFSIELGPGETPFQPEVQS